MTTAHEPPDLTNWSFEALLARLTSESCGLNQSELFRLFCQTLREFFGASGVCCCRASRQGDWQLVESGGNTTWGAQGASLSSSATECLAQAERARKAIVCLTPSQDLCGQQSDRGLSQVAVPFLSHDEFLGAAFVDWAGAVDLSGELLERLTLLGISFGGLLQHARLFEQVHGSRDRWVRVIDAIPDSIVVHNPEGNIVRINRPLADRLGVHPSRLIGRPIHEVLGTKREAVSGLCPLCSDQSGGAEGA